MSQPIIEPFFDAATFTLTYLVYDPQSQDAVILDPVLDFDPTSGRTSTQTSDRLAARVRELGLRVHYVLETHAHADHLSGSQYLKRLFGAQVAIGERIREVQAVFAPLFALDVPTDGSQFDRLLHDGETIDAGTLRLRTIATPGHTPACVSYHLPAAAAVFTGDAVFIEDTGTGRCDFPRGDAAALYDSVHDRLYALPAETQVYVGHDYQPDGRPLRFVTTVGREREANIHLRQQTSKLDFVALRTARDRTLTAPRLLLPSVQVNIDAGRLPEADSAGRRYLRLPLNLGATTNRDGTPA